MSDLFHVAAEPRQPASPPYPCLVLLHGRGANEEDLLGLAAELPPELFVVSFRAPYQMSWGGYCWYEIGQRGVTDTASFHEAFGMLLASLSALPERYPIDPNRLFLGGFSQGAMMSGWLTLAQPSLVRATIMLSGYLPPVGLEVDAAGSRGKPLFMAHGTFDSLLPLALAQEARDELRRLGLALEYHEYPMDHQVVLEELTDLRSWLERELGEGE